MLRTAQVICRAVSFIAFTGALMGSGIILSRYEPFVGVPTVEETFDWYAEHRDLYDTLFIGSSRIYHGIDPAVFDKLTAAAGVPTRSFNFGIDGMFAPENTYVFEHLAALRPKNLRWVFIENSGLRPHKSFGDGNNVRTTHWHDTARTSLVVRALLNSARSASAKRPASEWTESPWRLAGKHLHWWTLRNLNLGRGALYTQSQLNPVFDPPLAKILGHQASKTDHLRNGFVPIHAGGLAMPGDVLADYKQGLAELAADHSDKAFLDRDSQYNLDRMFAAVSALGAHSIVVIAPSAGPRRPLPSPSGVAPVLDYNDPEKFRELFKVENRVDRAHLNASGAEAFTRALAADFIEVASSRE